MCNLKEHRRTSFHINSLAKGMMIQWWYFLDFLGSFCLQSYTWNILCNITVSFSLKYSTYACILFYTVTHIYLWLCNGVNTGLNLSISTLCNFNPCAISITVTEILVQFLEVNLFMAIFFTSFYRDHVPVVLIYLETLRTEHPYRTFSLNWRLNQRWHGQWWIERKYGVFMWRTFPFIVWVDVTLLFLFLSSCECRSFTSQLWCAICCCTVSYYSLNCFEERVELHPLLCGRTQFFSWLENQLPLHSKK